MSDENFTHNIKRTSVCIAKTATGNKCKRRTCRSNYCWMHLKTQNGLVIKKSSIENGGLGLFTTVDRKKKDFVGPYIGIPSSREIRGDYVLKNRSTGKWIDAKYSNSCATRYINDFRNRQNNCKFSDSRYGINLKTTKPVKKGQELGVSYGPSYWT